MGSRTSGGGGESPKVVDSVRGWRYEICRGTCSFCGEVGAVLVCGDGESDLPGDGTDCHTATVCEACALLASLAWRRFAGEVPPGFPDEDVRRSTVAAVVVARRRKVGSPPDLLPRQVPGAYEFLAVPGAGGGELVPPSGPVPVGVDARVAARGILESAGLGTWPALCEPLHVGYTPRGRLATVILVRGYYQIAAPSQGGPGRAEARWSPWPPAALAGRMEGFYAFMQVEWPRRLYRHCEPPDQLPAEISVCMREVARRYVDLRSAVDAGGDVDSSMLAAYRSAMTEDESAAAEMVAKFEEEERRAARRCLPAVSSPADDGDGDEGGGEEAGEDGDEGDEGEGGDFDEGGDGPGPDPGFARSFKR